MKRIGIAASKMAKDSLFLYNFYVILISFLFSLFIFIVVGATIVLALTIISYVAQEVMAVEFQQSRLFVLMVCMGTLSAVIAVFNLFAISKNIKL